MTSTVHPDGEPQTETDLFLKSGVVKRPAQKQFDIPPDFDILTIPKLPSENKSIFFAHMLLFFELLYFHKFQRYFVANSVFSP